MGSNLVAPAICSSWNGYLSGSGSARHWRGTTICRVAGGSRNHGGKPHTLL